MAGGLLAIFFVFSHSSRRSADYRRHLCGQAKSAGIIELCRFVEPASTHVHPPYFRSATCSFRVPRMARPLRLLPTGLAAFCNNPATAKPFCTVATNLGDSEAWANRSWNGYTERASSGGQETALRGTKKNAAKRCVFFWFRPTGQHPPFLGGLPGGAGRLGGSPERVHPQGTTKRTKKNGLSCEICCCIFGAFSVPSLRICL
jgi:hypothetical protein